MRNKSTYFIKRIMPTIDNIFRGTILIFAIAFLVVMVLFNTLIINDTHLDLSNLTLTCTNPKEITELDNGSTIINDSNHRIICINPNGTLKFKIDSKRNQRFLSFAVDRSNNIYIYTSYNKNYNSSFSKDQIAKYNASGVLINNIDTISYTKNPLDEEKIIRISPLHIENKTLYFTTYSIYKTKLYQIDLKDQNITQTGTLTSGIPFFYKDVEEYSNGNYYYAKINGDLGIGNVEDGNLESSQKLIYSGEFDIKNNTGFRPSSIGYLNGTIYTFDQDAEKIYEVSDGKLITPKWMKNVNDDFKTKYFDSSLPTISGVSNDTTWYLHNEKIETAPLVAKISLPTAIIEGAGRLIKKVCLPIIFLLSIYIILCALWLVFIRGKKVAMKILFLELFLTIGIFILLYFGISSRYSYFLEHEIDMLQDKAVLTAQSIDGDKLSEIVNSNSVDTQIYKELSTDLLNTYGLHEDESDVAAYIVVPNKKSNIKHGSYNIITSNNGNDNILGNSEFSAQISSTNTNTVLSGSKFNRENSRIATYSTIYDSDSNFVGYLYSYSNIENIKDQFTSLWPTYLIAIFAVMLILMFFVSTKMFGTKLSKAQLGLKEISNGNLSFKMKESFTNDEIDLLIQTINNLNGNINTLSNREAQLTKEVLRNQYVVMGSLASIVENKSGHTGAHIIRVSKCVELIGSFCGYSENELHYLMVASMLHDVGKIFISSEILEKPGRLTIEEFEKVKLHTSSGEELLGNAYGEIMDYAKTIAAEHHEKWDGTGYMKGLKGNEICLEARITAVADVFDALMSKRPYKEAMPPEDVYKIIVSERGKHFDPAIVDIFIEHFDKLCDIIKAYPDGVAIKDIF